MQKLTHGSWLVALIAATVVIACGDDDDDSKSNASTGGGAGGKRAIEVKSIGQACKTNSDCGNGVCSQTFGAMGLNGQMGTPAPGGYCTSACSSDADCGSNAVCSGSFSGGMTGIFGGAASMTGMRGQCLLSCTASADCRDGYRCVNGLGLPVGTTGGGAAGESGDGDAAGGGGSGGGRGAGIGPSALGSIAATSCQPAPTHDKLTGSVVGSQCGSDEDCSGGRCMTMSGMTSFPGGYCTGRCLQDSDCGDGICGNIALGGTGTCYQRCESDSDCGREGYRCRANGAGSRQCMPGAKPLANGIVGSACASDADCDGAAMSCATMLGGRTSAPGGYCTQRCVESSDCGSGGLCVGGGLGTASGTCYKTCGGAADCREGYTCATRGIGGGRGMQAMMTCGPTPPPRPAPMDEDAGVP